VTVITSGRNALEVFLADPDRFHLLITDYTMPGMNGLELAKEVVRARPMIPVILCTGYGHMIDHAKLERIGVREVVKKPMLTQAIAAAIRHVLEKDNRDGGTNG
jgi:DNA-binding NtrC family response regulator